MEVDSFSSSNNEEIQLHKDSIHNLNNEQHQEIPNQPIKIETIHDYEFDNQQPKNNTLINPMNRIDEQDSDVTSHIYT